MKTKPRFSFLYRITVKLLSSQDMTNSFTANQNIALIISLQNKIL